MKTAILVALFPAALAAQFANGTVYDALTGAPLPGVSVAAQGPNSTVVRSDASGHFRIEVPANSVVLAAKAGYLQANRPVRTQQDIRIDLKPEAIITGKIVDQEGFPAAGATLQAMRYQVINSRRQLVSLGFSESNERGEYRLYGLNAGRYYIRVYASAAYNWDRRYGAQYLGGTLQPDEHHGIDVKAGETHKDADIQLQRFEGVTLSGRLVGVPTNRGVLPQVSLTLDQSNMGPAVMGVVDRDMTFTLRHVPPGRYYLRYGSQNARAGELTAEVPVEVADHDVPDLVLTPHTVQAIDLAGQVKLREGGTPGTWNVYLRTRTGYGVSAHTEEDGSFVAKGLLPEHYAVQVTPERRPNSAVSLPGHVVAMALGDVDVQENGFDLDGTPFQKQLAITVSNQYAILNGAVVDSVGAPVANAVLLFRSTQLGQRANAHADYNGNFRAMLNEAGDYHVLVIDQDVMTAQDLEDYVYAHLGELPLVHVVLGENAPVRLVRNARLPQ